MSGKISFLIVAKSIEFFSASIAIHFGYYVDIVEFCGTVAVTNSEVLSTFFSRLLSLRSRLRFLTKPRTEC